MYDIHEINSIDQLDPLHSQWRRLLSVTERAGFFHTLPWLQVYWKHFGAQQKLRLLVVTRNGNVLGILPWVVRTERRRVGQVRVLTWPLDDWGSFYGPLGDDPATLLTVGLRHINQTTKDWDLIDLRWMNGRGELASQTHEALNAAGITSYRRVRDQTALVDTRGTWDDYLAGKTSKWRNNLRRWRRKLAEWGEVSFERYRPAGAAAGSGDPRWDLLDECMDVARRSWQATSANGTTISTGNIRDFIHDAHAVAAEHGHLDLNLLRLDGRAVAFAYNYFFHGSVYGLRIGFDADLSRDGVGNLVCCNALEDSFRRDDHTFDMGPGSLDYKKAICTEIIDLVQFTHFRPAGVRAQAMRWKSRLTGELSPVKGFEPEVTRE
jgi:CelD/BcsL family acetyltransferase involved in cellulose biosynthesis